MEEDLISRIETLELPEDPYDWPNIEIETRTAIVPNSVSVTFAKLRLVRDFYSADKAEHARMRLTRAAFCDLIVRWNISVLENYG